MDSPRNITGKMVFGQVSLAFLAHGSGDFYAAFYGPLVPYLASRLDLTLGMVGLIGGIHALSTNFSQPVIGHLAERIGRRRLIAGGVLLSAVGMSLMGVAGSFAAVCVLVGVGGLGVGAMHPTAASIASENAGARRSTALSLFTSGGNVGVMLAPLAVTVVLAQAPNGFPLLAVPGIVAAVVLWIGLRRDPSGEARPTAPKWRELYDVFRRVGWVYVHVMLRFVPIGAFFVLLMLLLTLRGVSETSAGGILALYLLLCTLGGLLGGYLSDRVPRRPFVVVTELGAGVLFLLALKAEGIAFYAFLLTAGVFAYAAMPLQIVMAQERVPRSESTASGFAIGFASGTAGLFLPVLGWMGDRWEMATGSRLVAVTRELQVAACFMFVAALVGGFLNFRAAEAERDIGRE